MFFRRNAGSNVTFTLCDGRGYLRRQNAVAVDPVSLPLGADPDSLPESVFLDRAGPHRAGALGVQKTLEGAPHAGDLPDHLRNHAFLYDSEALGWRLSPVYDVVPRPSASHERYLHLGVGPQGRVSTLDNALAGCEQFGLTSADAAVLIDQIVRTVREWKGSFEALAVPGLQIDRISSAFRRTSDIGMACVERFL